MVCVQGKSICDKTSYKWALANETIDLDFRDLLLQNLPFYINLAAENTKTELKQVLAEAFVGKIKNDCIARHGIATQCVKSLQCEVNAAVMPFPGDTDMHHTIYWKLAQSRRTMTVNAMALGFDNRIFNYFNSLDELLETIAETDGRIKADYLRILRYFRFVGPTKLSCLFVH